MSPNKRIHWLCMLFLFLVWCLPALACNSPAPTGGPEPGISSEALRRTLAAQPDGPLQEATALPGVLPTSVITPQGDIATAAPTTGTTPTTIPPRACTPTESDTSYTYCVRSGDTLEALASRFSVSPDQITSQSAIPRKGFIPAGQELTIPKTLRYVTPAQALLPDSELIYSPSTIGFDVASFVQDAGGFLSTYYESVQEERFSGADIIQRVAEAYSVNPRLLLAFLEYRSHWVYGQPADPRDVSYPIGFEISGRSGLYKEISITATQLTLAYYGWRQGMFYWIKFPNDELARLDPQLNAGSVAIQNLLAMFYRKEAWQEALYGPDSFLSLYQQMFGDPWVRAATVEPLFLPGLAQPTLELPFLPGEFWNLTGGPHYSWNTGTPRGALDFSPLDGASFCAVSPYWATACAPGIVARAAYNAVALDLDGDGYEQTGWVLVYYHLSENDLVLPGTRVEQDDPLGHPSCEGGDATGKHVHIARKYNGEWLAADGPIPFVLGGWWAHAGDSNYRGYLVKDDQIVSADPGGGGSSSIIR